jgi:hypothetical protein
MCGHGDRLGPFQRMARNMGMEMTIVARLPKQWPFCSTDWSHLADALYEAGYPPGDELIRVARWLWRERPDYWR